MNNPAAAAKFGSRALAASQASKPPSQTAEPGASEQQDNLRSAFGRVSAASSAFANRGQDASAGAPPAPPSRANSSGSAGPPPAAPPRRSPSQKPESTVSGLVSRQTMGKLDTTSKMNALTSAFGKPATTTRAPAAPAVPAAFPARKTTMPPPPTRRVPSSDSVSSPPPSAPARRAAPEPEPEAEPEFSGEWADVLYDYSSTDPGDLNVKEGQQILITDRTSDDWWTAELNNKTGLVPASYVKVL